jgi:hypothetical protein
MTTITVKETKNQWENTLFTLFIDEQQSGFHHHGSRLLTNTRDEGGNGIFNEDKSVVAFKRKDTWVDVDFGAVWAITLYDDPALEIKHRIKLVEKAFEAVSEGYEKVWTTNLDVNIEYMEKRKEEAIQSCFYVDKDGARWRIISSDDTIEDPEEDEDYEHTNGIYLLDEDSGEEYQIPYSEIPQEAYFLKLTRIE